METNFQQDEMDQTDWDYLKTTTENNGRLLDAHVVYNSQTVLSDLDHLQGHTPLAIQDGVNYPQNGTVDASGNFTIEDNLAGTNTFTGEYEVGVEIEWEVKTLPLDVPAGNETQMGKVKGIKDVQVQMLNTAALTVVASTDPSNPENFLFRQAGNH